MHHAVAVSLMFVQRMHGGEALTTSTTFDLLPESKIQNKTLAIIIIILEWVALSLIACSLSVNTH